MRAFLLKTNNRLNNRATENRKCAPSLTVTILRESHRVVESYYQSLVLREVWILLFRCMAITAKERRCGEEWGGGFDD